MNTLVIGDLHSPFIKKGYLEHCTKVKKKYNCKKIYCIGDIFDNHYTSFWDTDPDGDGAGAELKKAIEQLKPWYKKFPNMDICIGNHDKRPNRKAFKAGISTVWVKTVQEILDSRGFSGWFMGNDFFRNGILFTHGDECEALTRMNRDCISVVAGDKHSKAYIRFKFGYKDRFFAMQTGCGLDSTTYAAAYNKSKVKMAVACGVILDDYTPLIETMRM